MRRVQAILLFALVTYTTPMIAGQSGTATTEPPAASATKAANHSGKKAGISGAITNVTIENIGSSAQSSVPVTFGQVFAVGDISATDSIVGKLSDGSTLPLQFNVKAKHPDGSIRHAIISTVLPSLATGAMQDIEIVKSDSIASNSPALTPSELLGEGFSASVNITLGGQAYTAAVDPLLKKGSYATWLSGPIANEWLVYAPLVSAQGAVHPHLTARFAIRSYTGHKNARVDVTVENDWAFQPAPQNFTYDVAVLVGGETVYTKSALTHYHHARWRKTFWWGKTPQINVRENTAYLIASKAVPNYDQTINVAAALGPLGATWNGSKTEPMGTGVAVPRMPLAGGRPDIGLLPGWAVVYLLSMDRRARDVTLGTADLAGSYSMHYRDQKTDRPVSVINYPYMTLLGPPAATLNPITKKSESFPLCNDCLTPYVPESAHQPALNYLPYLLTGDYYQLEELQFWAMWNAFRSNPEYRGNVLGLVHREEVRDQAWSLRNLADAAYITPDQDPLKPQLQRIVTNNLNWYNENYTNNPNGNALGINVDGYAFGYHNGLGMSPWMDDFFTSSVGHVADLGFVAAKPLLAYKAKFPVSRMTAPGFCWIFASIYSLDARTSITSPPYSNIAQTYASSLLTSYPAIGATLAKLQCNSPEMASALHLKLGEMVGHSENTDGYPSNLQPALAYSVDSGVPGAAAAWKIFMSRSVKPNYSIGPQFAIVPRE